MACCAGGAELSQKTAQEFRTYIQRQEAAMGHSPQPRWKTLRAGELMVAPWGGLPTVDVDDGLIHDWVAAYFVPGVKAGKVRDTLLSYNRYATIYKPEVLKAQVLAPAGGRQRLLMRVVKKKVITVVLDTEYEIESAQVSPEVFVSRSRSTNVWEVEDAGEPSEERKKPGTGYGFLWALNSYWYIEDRGGGAYVECRAVSLTRDIPTAVSWAVKPMITSLPKESLEKTLRDTVQAASR